MEKKKSKKQVEKQEIQKSIPEFKTYMMVEIDDVVFQMVNKNLKSYLQEVYEKYENDDIKSLEFVEKFLEQTKRGIKREDTNLFIEICFCLWMKNNDKIKIIY